MGFGDFPGSLVVKTSPSNAGHMCSIPGQGNKVLHVSEAQKPKHKTRSNIVTSSIDFKNGPHQYVYLKLVHALQQKQIQYYKTITFQLKIKIFKWSTLKKKKTNLKSIMDFGESSSSHGAWEV